MESREKCYTRSKSNLSSVQKVWVTQIRVQIPVQRTKVDTSSVRYCMFIQKIVPRISLAANSLKIFRTHRVKRVSYYSQYNSRIRHTKR